MDSIIEYFKDYGINAATRIVVAIGLLVVCFTIIKKLTSFLKNEKIFRRIEPAAKTFLISFMNITLKTIVIITAAAYIGVPIASLIALVSSVGLALGLAMQGGLSNIAGGIMILIYKPFDVGQYIETESNAGTVINVGMFNTTLLMVDNKHIVIPNSIITSGTVINYSKEKTRRIDLDFNIAYDSDMDIVRKVLLDTAKSNAKVISTPASEVVMTEHGASAIKVRLMVWCASDDYLTVKFSMIESVKRTFDKSNISIPYPQLDVHVDTKQ